MGKKRHKLLQKSALRIEQNQNCPLYLLSLTAEEILAVSDISRLARSKGGKPLGYQREEVRRHIQDIVAYLQNDDILLPNSIIIAFSSQVAFRATKNGDDTDELTTVGTLSVTIPSEGDAKPGWIVDGQQRVAALMQAQRMNWPVPVNAFIAEEVDLQRDQFLRVNNTKPLPRGLILELLPELSAPLPRDLGSKKLPSALCDLLNRDASSPFYGLIRRASTPAANRKAAVVADASVIKMLEESLTTPAGACREISRPFPRSEVPIHPGGDRPGMESWFLCHCRDRTSEAWLSIHRSWGYGALKDGGDTIVS